MKLLFGILMLLLAMSMGTEGRKNRQSLVKLSRICTSGHQMTRLMVYSEKTRWAVLHRCIRIEIEDCVSGCFWGDTCDSVKGNNKKERKILKELRRSSNYYVRGWKGAYERTTFKLKQSKVYCCWSQKLILQNCKTSPQTTDKKVDVNHRLIWKNLTGKSRAPRSKEIALKDIKVNINVGNIGQVVELCKVDVDAEYECAGFGKIRDPRKPTDLTEKGTGMRTEGSRADGPSGAQGSGAAAADSGGAGFGGGYGAGFGSGFGAGIGSGLGIGLPICAIPCPTCPTCAATSAPTTTAKPCAGGCPFLTFDLSHDPLLSTSPILTYSGENDKSEFELHPHGSTLTVSCTNIHTNHEMALYADLIDDFLINLEEMLDFAGQKDSQVSVDLVCGPDGMWKQGERTVYSMVCG